MHFISLSELEEQGKKEYIGNRIIWSYNESFFYLLHLDEEILKRRPEKKDIAVIMYTSGSTGTPKGCFLYLIVFI